MQGSSNLTKAKMFANDLPWNITDPNRLGNCIVDFVKDYEPFYRRWAEKWFENFQFIYGNQSVRWSKRWGFAVDVDFLRRVPSINMRAQTNLSRVALEALVSLLFAQVPDWEVEACEESSLKSRRIQKIVGNLLDAYMIRLNMAEDLWDAAIIFTAMGQFGAWVDWNPNAGQLIEIPQYRRIRKPIYTSTLVQDPTTGGMSQIPVMAKDTSGAPLYEDAWEAQLDYQGRQIIDKILAGDVGVGIMTPFEYRRAPESSGMHNTKWIQRFRLLDYDDYLDEYSNVQGQTRAWNSIRPIYANTLVYNFAIQHFMRMQYTAPPSLQDAFRGNESVFSSRIFKNKVFVIEHWDAPNSRKWPLGRRVVVTNGAATHVTVPSYNINIQGGWHPAVEAQWLRVRPNSLAAGPLNDVITKNREINLKDSLIATALRRNCGSTLFTKIGSGIDPQKITGTPGEVHEVLDPYGARWLHDEMPIPPVVTALREADKGDFWELSGAGEALRGRPSVGSSSGYQEKQREEREEKRLGPAKRSFERGVSLIGMKAVSCLKANVRRLDDQVVSYLKRASSGEYEIQDVIAFLSTPIDYGVDIRVKRSSMAIKSKATQQATLMELMGSPVAQASLQDPYVRDEILKFFDAEKLRDATAIHRDRADRENEVFEDMMRLGANLEGIQRPIVVLADDDQSHLMAHDRWFIANFSQLRANQPVMFEILLHMEQHRSQIAEKQGQLLPGTNLAMPQIMAQIANTPTPTVPQVQSYTIAKQQQAQAQAQMNAAAPQGQTQAPQAPRQRAAPGEPPGARTDPNAPSQSTPSAAAQGGQ